VRSLQDRIQRLDRPPANAMRTLPPVLGPAALVPILCLILAIVYCQIVGWLKLIVNLTTMTFLTLASMPVVQARMSFRNVFATLAFGVVYFAGLVAMGRWFVERAAAKQSAHHELTPTISVQPE
jgi:hypothetical protein